MSWYNQGQPYNTEHGGDAGGQHHGHSYSYRDQHYQPRQPLSRHHVPAGAGDLTRQEALQLIGELGQDRCERQHPQQNLPPPQQQQHQQRTAPLAEDPPPTPPPRQSRKRGREETTRSSGEGDDPASNDAEISTAPAEAEAPAPRKRRRRRGRKGAAAVDAVVDDDGATPRKRRAVGYVDDKPPRRRPARRGELRAELPINAALRATKDRPRLHAEIFRVYPGVRRSCQGKADRDRGDCAETEDDGGAGAGAGEEKIGAADGEGGGGEPSLELEPLPDRDPLPLFPLFGDPSRDLAALYDEVEAALEERDETWTGLEDARADLVEARRRVRDAMASDAVAKAALEVVKDRTREAEMVEPCWWNDMMARLRDFHNKNGHVRIPGFQTLDREKDPDLYELARFDITIKDRYRRGTLQRYPHRVAAVEEMGFNWRNKTNAFVRRVSDLKKFRVRHGHCDVTKSDDKALYDWVTIFRFNHAQRVSGAELGAHASRGMYKRKDTDRARRLYDRNLADLRKLLGGEEALQEWLRPRVRGKGRLRVEALQHHRAAVGHCVHPDPGMRRWVGEIRVRYRRRKEGRVDAVADAGAAQTISSDLVEAMDGMGFCWEDECKCEGAPDDHGLPHGDGITAEVNGRGVEEKNDGDKKNTSDDAEAPNDDDSFDYEVERPESLRIEPNPSEEGGTTKSSRKAWNHGLNRLREFKSAFGHCDVTSKDDGKLQKWLGEKKALYLKFQRELERNGRDNKGENKAAGFLDAEKTGGGAEMKVYIHSKVMTMTQCKQLEEIIGKDGFSKGSGYFCRMFEMWKNHKDKEGNCTHPKSAVGSWLSKCKARYKVQLKRERGIAQTVHGGKEQQGETRNSESENKGEIECRSKPKAENSSQVRIREAGDLQPWQVQMLTDAGVCWMRRCACDEPEKKAGMLAENSWIYEWNSNFDRWIAAMKEHRKKHGNCVHPDDWVRKYVATSNVKHRRRATLEKLEREEEGKRGESKKDGAQGGNCNGPKNDGKGKAEAAEETNSGIARDESNESREGTKPGRRKRPKKKMPLSKAKPFNDEQMARIEALNLCWGDGCECLRRQEREDIPNISSLQPHSQPQLAAAVEARAESARDVNTHFFADGGGNAGTFDRVLALFVADRNLHGRCHSDDPSIMRWYRDVQRRCSANVTGETTLAKGQIAALLRSGICLRRGPCKCHQKAVARPTKTPGAVLGLRNAGSASVPESEAVMGESAAAIMPPSAVAGAAAIIVPGLSAVPKNQSVEEVISNPVTKTVANLNPVELELLSLQVVDEVRRRDCWSSEDEGSSNDECSSDDDDDYVGIGTSAFGAVNTDDDGGVLATEKEDDKGISESLVVGRRGLEGVGSTEEASVGSGDKSGERCVADALGVDCLHVGEPSSLV